ncbi:MAG: hypothetical protein PHF14_10810 [Verrucomicrobiota bacterium]|jgi:hypothetical protein|nr:hypothetical protein [Verrucomicrobiota bacterium]MDD8046944.1 hypothetical protein [Verrucomicrobiota bacterium]MDD8051199.1 hypothetical protein [Verrucomicrobiota bacterium]MDI9383588.1 hypothetical protein [Verrucomicrobiota bacterium]
MNRDDLIRSALELAQPQPETAEEFHQKMDALAAELNRQMLQRPDLERLIGPDNQEMMQDNSRNFCRFMSSQFHGYQPVSLVETALWVFRAYRAHGFQITYWPAYLDTFVEISRSRLSGKTFEQVYPFLEWLILQIPALVAISDQELAQPLPEDPRHE